MTTNNSNPISTFIAGQLPEFVRVDHPTLVAFLTSYYEWLDADNIYLRSPQKLGNVIDIDRTLDEFIANFKNEYLFGFPETMAVSDTTKKPVDAIKLMKNIKGFYKAKGTEKTYDFLFRILYDTSVEFYYPKNDILKLSDGKWVVRRSIKVGNNTGKTIYDSVGRTVIQRNDEGGILASARVLDVSTYRVGTNDISELFLGGVNGEFVSGNYGIEFADADGVVRKENRVFSVLGKITINDAGTGYKTGDRIIFTPAAGDTGVRAAGRVGEVDTNGKIRKFIIDNFGVNYKIAPTITVSSESGTGFAGSVSVGGVSEYAGYYANNDGRLNTNKVMQDNHFYQNYSYVILSEVTIDRYRDILKRLLNPAGLAFFGKVQIKRCAVADLQQSTSLFEYDVPIIGHYTPYTFITNDDLSPWFSDPYTGLLAGYDPTQHDKTIRNDLDENGTIDVEDTSLSLLNGTTAEEYYKSIGNPVTFSREFMNPLVALKTAGFQNADPFWIIYQHPNRRIRGPVVARIPYDLKTEFLTDLGGRNQIGMTVTGQSTGTTGYWMEWTEASTANREEWSGGFTSGERYVMLNYNPLKDYTQSYYEPQTVSFAPNKSSLVQPGKLLPILYYDNVFTYAGQKNFEKLSSDNSNESQLLSTIPSNSGKAVNYDIPDQYEFSTDGKNVIGILSPSQATIQIGGLSDSSKNSLSQDPDKLLTTPTLVPPPLSYNKFAYWDSATSTHYLTYRSVTGGYGLPCVNCKETGHLGISGLTATSKEAISKMVKSLRGEIRPDWNGISGGGWENLDPFPADYNGLISMNTESWDALYSESQGIADPDNPNSVGNFIRDKILIPIFAGGVSPDGTTFGGLQENFPNAILANYGHPSATPRNILNYYGYPGFRGRGEFARGSVGETLTLPSGLTYTSYAPSVSCPTCVWDGRVGLHTLDPNKVVGQSSYETRRNIYSTTYPNQAVENTQFSEKLHTEKWYPFCKAVSGWQPSFYTATRDLGLEASHIGRSISLMSSWKSQIFQEQSDAGIEPTKKYLIPFISNKAFTVGTGDGGYAGWKGDTSYNAYTQSLQDLSFYTPNQFVDLYIAPCLSGQSKGAVDGFYMWTGEQSYTCQFGLGIGINNPLTVEVLDGEGNVIDWKKNPFTLAYGYQPYWDWNHNWFNKPGAPTGGSYAVGKNGTPRLSWYIGGGQFGDADPWQGGNISPSWPTSSDPLPLENSSQMYHTRKNIVAYQAFLDGVTGQYNAQYNYLEPHKYSYLASTFPTWFVPDESTRTETLPVWSEKTSNGGVKYLVLNGVKNPKDIKISAWRMGGLVTDTGHLVMFYDTETVFNTVKWATESIPTASGFDSLSVGYDHSIALKTDGTVVGWGNEGSYAGKLGTEGVMRQITAAGKTVTKVDAGANHNLALLNDGQVISWGRGQASQLSDIDKNWTPYGYTPQTDETFKNYQDRSTRWNDAGTIRVYRCALEDGNRASGCDSPNGSSLTAHHFAGGVSAGAYLAPGLTQGWEYDTGAPYDYQFPRSSTNALTGQNGVLNPNFGGGGWTAAAGGTSVFGTSYKKYVDISAGRSHNLILASDGKIETWGDNYYYTVTGSGLHNKDKRTSASPGGAWGRAGGGESPNPTGENTAPTVKSFKTTANSVARIGTGYYQSMVIRPDGSLFAWDRNEWGESLPASGLPSKTATGATGFVSVDGGYHHCCALRSNGTIACWGAGDSLKTNDGTDFNYGQSIVPDGLGTFTKVVCGYDYTIAVQASTGEIIVWGNTEQVKNKFIFKAPTLPNFTIDNKFVNILDWSRLREWNFRVKKTSNDGRWTIPMGMAPGTTFAFNHLSTRPADTKRPTNPIRSRAGVGVTGAIISNPLFNSLTGSSTVFSYSDGNSYKDKGWNTADRIGYVKAVRSVPNKPNEVEIAVEPYFFVGGPMYGQYYGADTAMWFSSSTVNYDGIPYYDNRDRDLMIADGITHGMTSGNAPYPTSMGVPNPVGTFAQLAKIGANLDPSTTNQQPKWGHIFTPGDIISFGAVGATFELVTYGQVSGNFQRTTEAEVDHVWSMVDNLVASQWSAALTYWNSLYNTGLDGDFSIQFNTVENSWNVYGPGNRNIINGWKPKTTPTSCSSAEIAPSISVAQNDADNSLEISYAYNNTCTTEKYMAWPDLPPMDLGESVSYFDTRINAGSFGSGVGAFIDLDKNSRLFSSNYPSQLYSPIHLAKTKFSGECCVDNNFAVSVALTEYSPSDDNHEISLVAFPPQEYPAVALRTTSFDVVTDGNFAAKISPTTTTETSKWAASWSTPTYGGATGTTHITTMFTITGRLSASPQFDQSITGATSAKNFLSSIPEKRRVILAYHLGAAIADEYWLSTGITLDNAYNTGDACRDSLGNFVIADMNDPREIVGRTGSYGGTQRFISPWLDNSAARAKASWDTWLTEYLAIGGSAQYFVLDQENNPTSVWSNWLRKNASDTTTTQAVDHMNHILSDPRSTSLTAGNASVYGSLKTQLKLGSGYTTSQFSNVELAMGASGGYKLWNSVMTGLASYYIDEFFTSPITSKYSSAKVSNYDNIRVEEDDYVSDSNGHKEYSNADVGNSVAPYLYGEVGFAGTVYDVYSQDTTRLNYNTLSSNLFGTTPWSGLLLSQQKLKAADRNRKTDGKGLQVWIASVKYYGSNAFGGDVNFHNEYWRENVYHALLHNPELLLYWNPSSTTAADDKYFHDAIDTVNNITNQKIYNTLDVSNEKLKYNTHFVVSGCFSANQNQNIFRLSFNKTTVNVVNIDGVVTTLGANETGIWLTTRQDCKTFVQKNYDSSTKTLFLSTNTSFGNTNYKAYQDRFSFQIATWNESQITQNGQAKLAAGQSKTYKVNIKFAKVPPVAGVQASLLPGMGSIGIGTDSAAIIETLTPYKEFLDRRYPPQTYTPDYRPVRGILLAYEHLIEPSPTASNYNPYGWDKNNVNYTLVGGYPNTIGYTGVAAYVKDQLENKGWDRAMIWTPSGLSYKIGANYPPRSVTHWTEPNRVYTPPIGATSSITNNMDDAETIMKTMVDALDDTKQVGFWLGYSTYSNTEFDSPILYPMGSAGFDVSVLQNNLSIVDNITNNSRGISKGIAGLDAWNSFSAVSPRTLDAYSLITTVAHPSIKYITEGRACDYMHRTNPTYIDFYSPSGITQVDSSFGLANYFTPDHETWVGMNFSNSIDLVVRGSSGCAHEIKMARGPLIKSVIDMGMIPVVFEAMEQDYIYGGPLTETGNCSCTGCDCCQDGCYTVQGIYDCQGCSGCFGCTGCGITGATCSGALCCGLLANGTECFNTFYGIYDCVGCSGYGGCTGCEVTPTDPCESCSSAMPCVNVWTGQLDCQGCSGCYGCTGCGQTAGATGCALCSSTNPGYTIQGIYDCQGCSGCHGFTGCSRGATGATGCNLCRSDLPCYTLAGIYDCEGCSGCFGCDGCTTIAPCVGCECCMTGGYNRVTGLKDCEGCSGCFGFTGCGMTGTTGSTGCSGSGGTACCGTTGNGTLCFNIVTGMYDCLGCSGFNGCTGCGITASLTGCAVCSPTSPCFTVDGIYDCAGCSGCHGCIGCSVTGPTSCTGCGCCSSSTTGACFNIVTGFYDCVGCSGCASCTGCGRTASVPCESCMTGGYNRVTGLKDCIGCSGCFGFTGCGVTAPATGCDRCSQIDPCYTTNIPSAYDCVGCSGCWQCTGCPVIEPSCTGANCCGITANGTQCWNTFVGIYDCVGCSGYGGCTGCGITGVSAGPTGCAACSTWLDLPCYNTVTGIYDCVGCSGCAGCTGCGITASAGCTGCGCCSEIYDCFNITGGYDCVGCSGCYNCGGCDQRYSLCSECTTGDCGITSSTNHQFCVDCGCSDIYSNCNQCTQLDCDDVSSVNNQFCKSCGCVSEVVDCAECLRLNCNGILCRTQCPDCYDGGGDGKYTNCNECLQGDCDFDSSINHEFCLGCGCQQRYTLCDQCTQNECDDQFNINHEFCYECGCTPTQDCDGCVAGGCVGDGCDLCVNCNTQEPYENCSQCVPADCVYPYRLNHTYCKETCGCNANGGTGGETGGISQFLNMGKEVAYSDFRKVTIRSFLTMPVGPEFDCKNSDVQPPPVPQVKATTINGVDVDRADWSTDSNNIVGSFPDNKSIYIDVTGVISETGSSAGLSTMLYLSYYAAISMWADLFIVDSTGKEYQMASVGPMATSANTVKITFPFINPQHPLSEPGAVSLGRGVFGGSFAYQGIQIPNNNCIYRLKIYFRNTSNTPIPGSTTIKEFNYQLI